MLDEIHKSPKWKIFLKGLIDEFSNRPPLLVTGSARLETFRKSGDAFLVHPFTKGISRSIRKEFKVYFFDWGAYYDTPKKLENVVASSLLK